MKPFKLLLPLLGVSLLALLLFKHFQGSTSPPAPQQAAFEATAESEEYLSVPRGNQWQQLHDPATGQIPAGIAQSELAFVNQLVQQANLRSLTVADDWVARGPHNIGGRTHGLAIDVTDENVILAGGASGGMFKSTDGGQTWRKTTAPNQLHSVTALAQNTASGKEHIWYYSTGSTKNNSPQSNNFFRGDGIYKSVDRGESWTQLSATVSGTPNQDDPFDYTWSLATFGEDGVFAGTASGLYRSVDGGASWSPVLNFEMTGDIRLNEDHRTEIIAAGDGSFYATVGGDRATNGIYHSSDGETWENISPLGWPASTLRTVMGTAAPSSNAIYFFTSVAPLQQLLYKYQPSVGWTDLTSGLPFNAQMTTFEGLMLLVDVKPDDENTIFLGAINLFRSTDGGLTFEEISSGSGDYFHVDQTAIAFYPSQPHRMIVGNDGGLYRTDDNEGATRSGFPYYGAIEWAPLNNGYLTTQFYTVALDHGTPGSETLIGGSQDNGIIYTDDPDPDEPWRMLISGDGGQTAITGGGDYLYSALAASWGLHRYTFSGGVQQRTEITPASAAGLGVWQTIFQLDTHDQRIMYLPSRTTLWRNTDLTAIPHQSGGGPTDVNWEPMDHITGYYFYALGMSEATPRRLYYAAADITTLGTEVFYLDNPHEGDPVPVNITGENFPFYPYSPYIRCINVDPRDGSKVMVVFPNYGIHSIYATEDAGQSWTPVGGNLEENPDGTGSGPSVRWITTLYVDDQPVYLAGTSVGLFSSTELDGMNTIWSPEAQNTIGNVPIDMIDVRQSDGYVAVATYANGIYTTYITEVPDVAISVTEPEALPATFTLSAAYPNPFNASTTLAYELPRAGMITASVYNLRGQKIETLFQGWRQAGKQEVKWNAMNIASGVYFIRLDFEGSARMEKVVMQK